MSRLRTSAIAAATLLLLVHVGVLALRYGTDLASLWGDWIDAIAPLIAAVICWRASHLAGPFGRRLWRLTSFSALLVAASQALYTDYYDYLHVPLGTIWPSDVLVFFWVVPLAMTLFLSPRDPNSGYQWLRVCDFAQVCTLALAIELSEIYMFRPVGKLQARRWKSTQYMLHFSFMPLCLSALSCGDCSRRAASNAHSSAAWEGSWSSTLW